eukprot:TCALIF_07274-PA protein Name:"Similar to LysX Lysozyme X (Drosophila melanogaster)" AED:0.48 eAED:0.48 QI:0/0.33/0.25/1/0/0.25/4/0/130
MGHLKVVQPWMGARVQYNRDHFFCLSFHEILKMWLKVIAIVLLSITPITFSVTLERCELANLLLNTFNLPKEQIADWVCLARHESEYNTTAVGTLNADGSRDLGIFQISEKWWCEWGKRGKACRVQCEGG